MPPESTVRSWVRNDTGGFAADYHQAQLSRVDCLADELLCVAYDQEMDPATRRVITENIRWLISKLSPQRYGERLLVAGGDAPIKHLHEHQVQSALESLSPSALEDFSRTLLAERKGRA